VTEDVEKSPEGVHLSDDQAKLARRSLREYAETRRAALAALVGRQLVERVGLECTIDDVEDLLEVLDARLELLCSECGAGPDQWCKMDCSTKRYGPKSARYTLTVDVAPRK
jgi:hypothetical protein